MGSFPDQHCNQSSIFPAGLNNILRTNLGCNWLDLKLDTIFSLFRYILTFIKLSDEIFKEKSANGGFTCLRLFKITVTGFETFNNVISLQKVYCEKKIHLLTWKNLFQFIYLHYLLTLQCKRSVIFTHKTSLVEIFSRTMNPANVECAICLGKYRTTFEIHLKYKGIKVSFICNPDKTEYFSQSVQTLY